MEFRSQNFPLDAFGPKPKAGGGVGPQSRRLAERLASLECPAFSKRRSARANADDACPIVLSHGAGSYLWDVDDNRYVDLAAGFGAVSLGHNPEPVAARVQSQLGLLWQGLGDLYGSEIKACLLEELAALYPEAGARVMLGQSGSDGVAAALKTAALTTGRTGVVAFQRGYHGLGYGPLPLCGYRESYRAPFAAQLNQEVTLADYPLAVEQLERSLGQVRAALVAGAGAVVVEPILGRGGCIEAAEGFLAGLRSLCDEHGALLIADEIWTGMGRSGAWAASLERGTVPDLICFGKGLGGGMPISACVGRLSAFEGWAAAEDEVVHTATFFGAPLACAAGLATLQTLRSEGLVERSLQMGARWKAALEQALLGHPDVAEVRAYGLMIGIESRTPKQGLVLGRRLLEAGYVVLSGGLDHETLTLTPALTIPEAAIRPFAAALKEVWVP